MATDPSPVDEGTEPVIPEANLADDGVASDAPVTEPQDANDDPAASSSADGTEPVEGSEDAKSPKTLLEAVEQVLDKPSDKGEADPSPAKSGEEADAKAKPEGEEGEGKEGEPPPFHEHPRWKQLVAERDDLKAQIEKSGEDTQAIDRLETYLGDQSLSVDEFNKLLVIGGLMKNDPAKALEALTPYVVALQEITGSVLPADIQQAVTEGRVTEDYGRQLSKARADANIARNQTQVATESVQVEQRTNQVNLLGDEASVWEREWQASDPDYSKKADLVREKVELAILRGEVVQTGEQVRALCQKAKQDVETELRAFVPTKKAVNPNTPNSTTGGVQNASEPKSLLEAMQLGLEAQA